MLDTPEPPKPPDKPPEPRQCAFCGALYTLSGSQRFCSTMCLHDWYSSLPAHSSYIEIIVER